MNYLIIATICFSFSFGLIKGQLTGIPSDLVAGLRLFLAGLIFLPFFGEINLKTHLKAAFIGIIQFGLMYIFFIKAFQYLQGSEVVLLTTSTPALVAICSVVLGQKFRWYYFAFVFLAILGAVIVVWDSTNLNFLIKGIILMEASNFCFALGQVLWKKYIGVSDAKLMSSAYLIPAFLILFFILINKGFFVESLTSSQWASILYLGFIPTGVGFWLWNRGAKIVNPTILSIMNNLKIPIGVLFALFIFHETINIKNFFIGSFLILISIILTNMFVKDSDKIQV